MRTRFNSILLRQRQKNQTIIARRAAYRSICRIAMLRVRARNRLASPSKGRRAIKVQFRSPSVACDHPFADAAEAIGRKPNRNQALVVSLAGAAARRENSNEFAINQRPTFHRV
jgi:hypothetical protein